jgi:hypothetical protein
LQREEAWENRLAKIQNFYRSEAEKDAEKERAALLARLAKATEQIRKSDARAERVVVLSRRGVVRGVRK